MLRRTLEGTVLRLRVVRAPGPGLRALIFVCIAAALASFLPAAGAEPVNRLQAQADELRRSNQSLATQAASVQADLRSLDAQLAGTRAKLAKLRARGAILERKQTEARLQLKVARDGLRVSQRRLAARVRALYEQGKPEPLAVILGAETIDQAVSGVEHLGRMADEDRSFIHRARSARTRMISVTAALAQAEAENESLRAAASQAASTLIRARAQRLSRIAWLAAERTSNGEQISSLESTARALAAVSSGSRLLTVVATGYALPGNTASGIPVRTRSGRRRSVGDPARHAAFGPGLRAGDRGRHGRRNRRRAHRPLVLLACGSARLGTPHGHDLCRRVGCCLLADVIEKTDLTASRPADSLRVLLVDDHDLFRTGLRNLLEEQNVQVIGEAADGSQAIRMVRELAPDVVVMDLNMPGMTGVEATRQVTSQAPLTRVVVLTISDQDEDVMNAILAGACGYLMKDSSIQDLMQGIRAAAVGESLISPHIAAKVLQRMRATGTNEQDAKTIRAELSDREIQVLKLIANGKDNAQIAGELHISPKTVKNHISNILMKLQIDNRIQAAVYAVRSGIV